MANFNTLDDLGDIKGKVVFIRADLNVPAKEGVVSDTTRIDRFAPTLVTLADKGAKVIVTSHFGRPDGEKKPEFSMAFIVPELEKASGKKITFVDDCIGPKVDSAVAAMKDGDVIMLENLRFYDGEEKNDAEFCKTLAKGVDIYVNDAFSTAHRAHASTAGMAQYVPVRVAGRLMQAELEALDKALGNSVHPVAALVGGSKVSTKLDLLGNLVKKVDYLLIGGGMAHTFLAAKGIPMGEGSLVEPAMIETAKSIMANAGNCTIVLPTDLVWANEFGEGQEPHVADVNALPAGKPLLDIGPKSTQLFIDTLNKCKTLIWNGPVGAFEIKPFDTATNAIAAAVVELTKAGKLISVAGGGDTVSALKKAGAKKNLTYVSAAGGAFLEWMEGKQLPGVKVLEK
ncbi:MAG: phosphoglycerate kinase [Alphaproteobacteria bacterium]|nr:phosphoglycerate kinase [Alphaproteobacteria bacterium]